MPTISSLVFVLFMTSGLAALHEEDYKIASDTLPEDVRFRPPIGNGHVATNVFTDTVYMNGLYNGLEDKSSRARIPAYVAFDINMTNDVLLKQKFILDMYNGVFLKYLQTSKLNVTITSFAHRSLFNLLVTQVNIIRYDNLEDNITVYLSGNYGKDSSDLIWKHQKLNESESDNQTSMYHYGQIREPELPDATPSKLHVYHTVVPDTLTLPSGTESMTLTYIASHSNDQEDAHRAYRNALRLGNHLLTSHKQEWNKLWEDGRIDIYGNKILATNIAAAFYNILSSLPTKDDPVTPFYGLGPGGLSRGGLLYPERPGGGRNDYAGHVFWDMDTWIMPPIMMFHPAMASRMLGARTRVLDQAKKNAERDGYTGAKFPWEQASTGIEATPRWAGNMSLYEIHVTADIAYGLRQYLYAGNDVSIITEARGLEMAIEIARFWYSRVTETDNNTVEILGVMGPDEYHFNVNNSVFTNYNAKLSLQLPGFIIGRYNVSVNETIAAEVIEFEAKANKMLILFDKRRQYHPQYENFNLSGSIKQSDVVLLGYPLMMPMDRHVRRNDLELYEKITDAQGPDTGTWSMHTVGWLELGEDEKAYKNFRMMFRNINEPFKVFSEKPVTKESYGGCVNFITGAGGLLQSIVFGYGGLRLHSDRLEINPKSIPTTTSWRLKGIHYNGVVVNIDVHNDTVSIFAVKLPRRLKVTISGIKAGQLEVRLNDPIVFKKQVVSMRVQHEGSKDSSVTTTAANKSQTTASAADDIHFTLYYTLLLMLILTSLC
ncbi:protein-glucosylgalactosylhydroxylysine glucosidase-like [Mercenaria mercenaria]|uniref:protein-glucosylgalactosylhydroxylysine glucosidase-like n=1 Tax=Mercenaria mercenaria TaxID=6596 RepID=UPI00234EEF72|nr:protein-glucosylgalactosylhydroxylysine glucosidase-like [Mercenaria mercenaria]